MPVRRSESDATIGAFRTRLRTWLAGQTNLGILAPSMPDADGRQWHHSLARGGWLGVDWPTSDGGQGLSPVHRRVVCTELIRRGAPEPLGSIGEEGIGPTITRFGTDLQRRRLLGPMLMGEEIWSIALSEPEDPSELAGLTTHVAAAGDDLLLTGRKTWVPRATSADWCAVLARTDSEASPADEISYLLVDLRAPGVTVCPTDVIAGGTEYCDLLFDAVRVSPDRVLGTPGSGWVIGMDTLNRLSVARMIRRRVGLTESLSTLVSAVREISEQHRSPALADVLGNAQVCALGLDSLCEAAALERDAGAGSQALDALECLALSDAEHQIYGLALDLLGPRRVMPGEHPLGLDARRTIAKYLEGHASAVGGISSQRQRTIVAEGLLGFAAAG